MKRNLSTLVYIFLGILTVSICLHLFTSWFGNTMPALLLAGTRWLVLAFIFIYALRKGSLTTWILFSMLAGAEFGHDFQAIAIHLNIISKIFLNLIRTIIAATRLWPLQLVAITIISFQSWQSCVAAQLFYRSTQQYHPNECNFSVPMPTYLWFWLIILFPVWMKA